MLGARMVGTKRLGHQQLVSFAWKHQQESFWHLSNLPTVCDIHPAVPRRRCWRLAPSLGASLAAECSGAKGWGGGAGLGGGSKGWGGGLGGGSKGGGGGSWGGKGWGGGSCWGATQMRRRIVVGGHQMRSHLCQLPWIRHQFLRPRRIHHQVSWHFSLHILHFSILLVHLDCFEACTVIPVSKDWVAGTEWFVHSSSEDRCQAGPRRRIYLLLDFLLVMALDRTWSLRRREECIRRCLSLLHLF